MSDTDTLEHVDQDLFVMFEENFNEDMKCNLNHELIGAECSITVVAIGTSCQVQVRLCAVATNFIRLWLLVNGACPWCKRLARECWTIVPA